MLLVGTIGVSILAVYGVALWWLLRDEQPWTCVLLTALCGLSLALRLVLTHEYPPGLNPDEPKNLHCSMQAVERGEILGESCNGPPYLLSAVFAVPLVPLVGGNHWAMRSYSMLLSVLATPAAFAVARAMGLRVAGALVAGGLVAVLPWALFFGRMTLGGELIFHQLLLLAGLARLVWSDAASARAVAAGRAPRAPGWRETLLASFGLALLLWDYYAGRAMMGMPLLAAVLATGRRRLWCLAVPVVALIGWAPHLSTHPSYAGVGFSLAGAHPEVLANPLPALLKRTEYALWTFVWPVGQENIFTVRSAAMHPVFVLALAALGALTGVRRCLFLVGGFVGGILPGVVSNMFGISTHRIIMAYVFVALAAACAVNLAPWRWLRGSLASAVLVAAGVWSISFYFSDAFWPNESRLGFAPDRTALSEEIERRSPATLIVMHQIGYYSPPPPKNTNGKVLSVDNWLPPQNQAVTYAFTDEGARLRPQYERLFPGRVVSVGKAAFVVQVEANDWSWLRKHGWWYEMRCGDKNVYAATVPFLFSNGMPIADVRCGEPATHLWRAHWDGPTTPMVFDFSGRATIEDGGLRVEKQGFEQSLPITVSADSDVAVTLEFGGGVPWPHAALYESIPAGLRLPDWERFTPLPPGVPAAGTEPAAAPAAVPASAP